MGKLCGIVLFLAASMFPCMGMQFIEPFIISGEGNFRLSVHARRNLAVTSQGEVFATYWSKNGSVSPQSPSLAFVQKRSISREWEDPVQIHEGFGARHSALLYADKTLHAVWHDYRHCTNTANWMDRVEIYYDRMPVSNYPALEKNIRVTAPQDSHPGNNRFVPVPLLLDEKEIGLVWYDFYFDGHRSEIFFTNTSEGDWAQDVPHEEMALTRGAGEREPFTMPDAAAYEETMYLVWTDTVGWVGNLYYGIYDSESFRFEKIAQQKGGYFDPPSIYLIKGKPYILATSYNDNNESAIIILEVNADEPEAEGSVYLTPYAGRACRPVLYISGELLYIAWLKNFREIKLAGYSYPQWQIKEEYTVFEKPSADNTMYVGLNGFEDDLYLLWNYGGDVHFTSSEKPTSVIGYDVFR